MITLRTLASLVSVTVTAAATCLGFAAPAAASAPAAAPVAVGETGSLLVYPCFDNRLGATTVLGVVNTHPTSSIAVELIYIDGDSCLEFNRTVVLTPKDAYSVVTREHFPSVAQGYVYAFAKRPGTGVAVSFDHLAGTLHLFAGASQLGFKAQPFVFRSAAGIDDVPTDVDTDGIRDLNDIEYEAAPDVLVEPHFLGNGNLFGMNVEGTLVLLGLTGIQFRTVVDFAVYNDNEQMFSTQVEFDCWERLPLRRVANVFRDDFLNSTNDDPQETQGLVEESGWYEMDGRTAFSVADQVDDPAFLALQVETNGLFRHTAAALPFFKGTQTNGDLLPVGIFADEDMVAPVQTALLGGGFFSTKLFDVNKGNGALTELGTTAVGIEGLAMDVDTNTLYATDIVQDVLFVIDVGTGAAMPIGPHGFAQVRGLAYDSNADVLYGVDSDTDQLIRIDTTTGAGTAVGALGFGGARGLAFDPGTNTLYGHGASTDTLYTIDRTTGAGTAVGPIGIRSPRGLAFDPASGKLFATGDDLMLYEVDPATGVSTPVGPTTGDRIGGLAVDTF